MPLDDVALRQLAESLAAVKRCNGRRVPREVLARLADALPQGVGMSVDFDAGQILGHPLVVLRPLNLPPAKHQRIRFVLEKLAAGAVHDRRIGSSLERPDVAFTELSAREREVAGLVATGLRNKDVALALGITVGTVKDHVHRILQKSGLDSRAAIAAHWGR